MPQPPFITYAQNGEDVLLWRALKDVQNGFYIDVGAQDPVSESVTKAFYERGWHGINIEPVPHWHERLVQDRPHDINLRIAVSNQPGTIKLYEVEGTGLSTSDADFADRHKSAGYTLSEHVVECVTLDQICADRQVETVHFLKIDCEGCEKAVLEGISLTDTRPWIILIEATEPNSTAPTWDQWEKLLTDRGYGFVFFDGLNRFYVADEHPELVPAFDSPVNVFDRVQRASEVDALKKVGSLQGEVEALKGAATVAKLQADLAAATADRESARAERDAIKAKCRSLTSERDSVKSELDGVEVEREQLRRQCDAVAAQHRDLQANHAALLRSHSWRVTAPLRGCSRAIRWVLRRLRLVLYWVARPFAHVARPGMRWLARSRWLSRAVVHILGEQSYVTKALRLFLFGAARRDGTLDVDRVMDAVRAELVRSKRRR